MTDKAFICCISINLLLPFLILMDDANLEIIKTIWLPETTFTNELMSNTTIPFCYYFGMVGIAGMVDIIRVTIYFKIYFNYLYFTYCLKNKQQRNYQSFQLFKNEFL